MQRLVLHVRLGEAQVNDGDRFVGSVSLPYAAQVCIQMEVEGLFARLLNPVAYTYCQPLESPSSRGPRRIELMRTLTVLHGGSRVGRAEVLVD